MELDEIDREFLVKECDEIHNIMRYIFDNTPKGSSGQITMEQQAKINLCLFGIRNKLV